MAASISISGRPDVKQLESLEALLLPAARDLAQGEALQLPFSFLIGRPALDHDDFQFRHYPAGEPGKK